MGGAKDQGGSGLAREGVRRNTVMPEMEIRRYAL
jgi:hypothetical protein